MQKKQKIKGCFARSIQALVKSYNSVEQLTIFLVILEEENRLHMFGALML
jgi:hypothetical protein